MLYSRCFPRFTNVGLACLLIGIAFQTFIGWNMVRSLVLVQFLFVDCDFMQLYEQMTVGNDRPFLVHSNYELFRK